MQQGHKEGDGRLSHLAMEGELARPVLAVGRQDAESGDDRPAAEFIAWFEAAALDLINRVSPDPRPFVLARVRQSAKSKAGLRISALEVDRATLSFAPAGQAPSAPAA